MQQQCVSLHTSKDLAETANILNNEGMEIVFKTDGLFLTIDEMNEEEKVSWIKTIEINFRQALTTINENEINAELFFEQSKSMKKTILEIINLMKNNTSDQLLSSKYDLLDNQMKLYNKKTESFGTFGRHTSGRYTSYRRTFNFDTLRIDAGARCSLLIAKHENNFIRYLSFEEDPVLTITGPNATNLKTSLESKFWKAMQQKLVYLHTNKNLKETEEILKKQGIEIILKTDSMQLHFSDMTEEEQLSYLETLEVVLDYTSDKLEIQDKEIEILTRKGYSFSKELRKIINSLKNSRNTDTTKRFQLLQVEYKKIRELEHMIDQLRYRSRSLNLYDEVRCSCLIAKMGTDVIRYLAFEDDPVLTITGPNATNLKSSLEKMFWRLYEKSPGVKARVNWADFA